MGGVGEKYDNVGGGGDWYDVPVGEVERESMGGDGAVTAVEAPTAEMGEKVVEAEPTMATGEVEGAVVDKPVTG